MPLDRPILKEFLANKDRSFVYEDLPLPDVNAWRDGFVMLDEMLDNSRAYTGVSKCEFASTENSLVIRFKTEDSKIPMFVPGDSQILSTTERQNLRYFREIINSCEFFRTAKKLSILH